MNKTPPCILAVGLIVMADTGGYVGKSIGLPNFYGEVDVLAQRVAQHAVQGRLALEHG